MEIRPFRGWRFDVSENGDISDYIAPPYDVLTADDKRELLERCNDNIVGVDLPHVPPSEAGPDSAYEMAAGGLEHWKADGTIRQDDRPAIYVYEQTYTWAGQTHIRRAMLCGVRATELGKDVIPHEHTFAGPKADRLKLTEHTKMQLSPIFGFYNDSGRAVADMLAAGVSGPPRAWGQLGEVEEKLWVLDDPGLIEQIAFVLRDVPAFIADGHHRYITALNYRDALVAAGGADANHPANFVMFALVARDDPGLLVLPTHRILRGLAGDFSVGEMVAQAADFDWQRCSVEGANLSDADALLRPYGPGAMAVMGARPAEIWIAKLTRPEAMVEQAPDELDVWRELDVAVLHKLIIDKALAPWRTDNMSIEYTPDGRKVQAACDSGSAELGVCLQSTPVAAVERIALAGASMPHKSTYFFPKLATGMVLKPVG